MKLLGLDIGTTTISAVVVEGGVVLSALTLKNESFMATPHAWERIQDPSCIRATALQAVEALLEKYPDTARIGITGQMHGIVYLDATGTPVSPLYIWQDGRGDQPYCQDQTYAQHLSKLTGYPLATGYGLVTHYYNLQNGLVPDGAVKFCTIHDYIAMLLCGNTAPITDASDAASFGLFDLENGCFDVAALEKAGISPGMLPELAKTPHIGFYRKKIPVYVPIGDNQASFLGSTGGKKDAMLVNMGTGGQFSVYTQQYMQCPGLETRPFPGGYLLVGSSLCGGRAYALLEQFLRQTTQAMTGCAFESCYDAMNALLSSGECPEDLPTVAPLFQGTRLDSTLRGSITGLNSDNFTPRHLIWAMLKGMAAELHDMYECYLAGGGSPAVLIGSGNGLRKNIHLQRCFSGMFGQTLVMSQCNEEAATGAALFAQNS